MSLTPWKHKTDIHIYLALFWSQPNSAKCMFLKCFHILFVAGEKHSVNQNSFANCCCCNKAHGRLENEQSSNIMGCKTKNICLRDAKLLFNLDERWGDNSLWFHRYKGVTLLTLLLIWPHVNLKQLIGVAFMVKISPHELIMNRQLQLSCAATDAFMCSTWIITFACSCYNSEVVPDRFNQCEHKGVIRWQCWKSVRF